MSWRYQDWSSSPSAPTAVIMKPIFGAIPRESFRGLVQRRPRALSSISNISEDPGVKRGNGRAASTPGRQVVAVRSEGSEGSSRSSRPDQRRRKLPFQHREDLFPILLGRRLVIDVAIRQ